MRINPDAKKLLLFVAGYRLRYPDGGYFCEL
jgi:hypothetical protein